MQKTLKAPKMESFQESLATILKVNILVLNRDGKLLAAYNRQSPPFSLFEKSPELEEDYREFFRMLPSLDWDSRDLRALRDPLGLSAAAFSVDGELLVLLLGCLNCERDSSRHVLSRLGEYGIADGRHILAALPPYRWPELREQLSPIRSLYIGLLASGGTGEKAGQGTPLPLTEQVTRLMLSLLNLENLSLENLLRLVANSLILLLNAQGSWVSTYHLSAKTVTVCRCAVGDEPVPTEETWEKGIRQEINPRAFFANLNKPASRHGSEPGIETVFLNRKAFKAFLGVIEPGQGSTAALLAFSRQVALALEIYSVYQTLQQRLKNLLKSLNHGLIVTNTEGTVMLANQAACSILAAQDIFPAPGISLEQSGLPPDMAKAAAEAASRGTSRTGQESFMGEGESALYLSWDAGPLLDDDNRIIGAILYLRDITREVNLKRQLQNSERLAIAGEVAASLVHEIRNPLTVAMGSLQFVKMVDDAGKRQKFMQMTLSELKRMNQILTNFLSISRPNHDMAVKEMDPGEALQEISSIIRSEAMHNDIDLEIQQEAAPLVLGSKNGLKQVCLNLAKNAMEATGRGGRLLISLNTVNGRVNISFKDNGPGIAEEHFKNIFRPFFTTKEKGTGLGLCVSKRIIEDMGAELCFESVPGQGATFNIVFPRHLWS